MDINCDIQALVVDHSSKIKSSCLLEDNPGRLIIDSILDKDSKSIPPKISQTSNNHNKTCKKIKRRSKRHSKINVDPIRKVLISDKPGKDGISLINITDYTIN